MDRILAAHREVRERSNQLRIPRRQPQSCWPAKPGNELWSWDVTKLLGSPAKWTYFYLYTSRSTSSSRYVVGWMVAHRAPPSSRKGGFVRGESSPETPRERLPTRAHSRPKRSDGKRVIVVRRWLGAWARVAGGNAQYTQRAPVTVTS